MLVRPNLISVTLFFFTIIWHFIDQKINLQKNKRWIAYKKAFKRNFEQWFENDSN